MPEGLVPFRPIRGINLEVAETAVSSNEVVESRNFLFERGEATTRDGVTPLSLTSFTGNPVFASSKRYGTTPFTLVISSNAKIYKLVGTTATEITGAGITFGAANFHNVEVVNGIVVIGNSTGGVVFWDPTGTTYAVSAGKYRYVTSHLSRTVAAYDTNASALLGPRTVGWTEPGDEDDWAGAGSGSTVLADAVDDITGLGVLSNVVVILRRSGIHLGYPTGISTPVFRFDNFIREGAGCYYPMTAAFEQGVCAYVSIDDVYMFNLMEPKPIGKNIRKELIASLRSGATYNGFFTRISGASPKLRYHLVKTSGVAPCPHYIYDVEEDTWSRHTYDSQTVVGGWQHVVSTSEEYTTLLTSSGILRWDPAVACETPAYLRSGILSAGELDQDVKITRGLLRYRDRGCDQVTIGVESFIDENALGSKETVILPAQADQRHKRKWIPLMHVGQDFQVEVEVEGAFAMDYLGLLATPSGRFRGA